MEHEEQELTAEDFDSREDWLRYRWEAGLPPIDDLSDYNGVRGSGYYADLTRAVYGHNRRQYLLSWEHWGESDHIDFEDLSRVFRAIALANCRGCVMSTRLDITWSTLGISSEITIRQYFRQFLDWLRRWLERNADWPAYVAAFENGKTRGLHTHMLLYVPLDLRLQFTSAAKRALSRVTGCALLDTPTSQTMKIRVRGPNIDTQWIRFRYIMKGIHPQLGWDDGTGLKTVAERTGIQPKASGTVGSKRVAVCRELDHESYKRWAAVNELPDMAIRPCGEYLYGSRFLNWYIEHSDTLIDPRNAGNGRRLQETEEGVFE